MSDSPRRGKTPSAKDMYWFAHGGDLPQDKNHPQKNDDDDATTSDQSSTPPWKSLQDRKALPEESRNATYLKESMVASLDGADNSPALSLSEREDRVSSAPHFETPRASYEAKSTSSNLQNSTPEADDDRRRNAGGVRLRSSEKRMLVGERKKQILEAEQEKNELILKKNVEREATFEARRNAQRSNIAFAFGSSLPRNLELEVTTVYQGSDLEKSKKRTSAATSFSQRNADDKMSQSMISPSASRGRRKNDLTPTVPYDRTGPSRNPAPSSPTKRSVSMTRLDQLALPRRHYVEAHRDFSKANSTSSTSSSLQKDVQRSPSRPRSSMSVTSEQSGGSSRVSSNPPVSLRPRTSARRARPVSIAGSLPEHRPTMDTKSHAGHNRSPEKKNGATNVIKRTPIANKVRSPRPKSANLEKMSHVAATTKQLTPKSSPAKLPTKDKKLTPPHDSKPDDKKEPIKTIAVPDETPASEEEEAALNGAGEEKNSGKRIISEEEARAALAEKRRLAREQAEKEAEVEKQRQEELKLVEEERIRKEEEEQRQLEEEQLRLLEEHKKYEEEKLRKAIEEQERKEEEEKLKREEEARIKAEQEKKAKEEAEKQRIELEEKLKREEEERAERKKRLEKIMSRTRGKSGNASPVSNLSGGDHSDGTDSQMDAAEALSGNSSLNSNHSEQSSGSVSLEVPQPPQESSETESLNSMDMIALSENSSLDSNLLMLPSDSASLDSYQVCDASVESGQPSEQVDYISSEENVTEASTPKVADTSHNVLCGASGDEDHSTCSSENVTFNATQNAPDVQMADDQSSLNELPPVEVFSDNQIQEKQVIPQDSSVELHSNATASDYTEEINFVSGTELEDHLPDKPVEGSPGDIMQSAFVDLNKAVDISSGETNPFNGDYNDYDQEKCIHAALEFSDNFKTEIEWGMEIKPVRDIPEGINMVPNSNELKQPCDINLVENESSDAHENQLEGHTVPSLNPFGDNYACSDPSELTSAPDASEVSTTKPKLEENIIAVDDSASLGSNAPKDILTQNSDPKILSNSGFAVFSSDFQASGIFSVPSNHFKNSCEENVSNVIQYEDSVTSIEDLEMNSVNLLPSSRINLIGDTCASASLNDSEDSSLDSNLSQAMNIHITPSINPEEIESYNDLSGTVRNGHLVCSNTEQGAYILDSKSMQQYQEGTYIPKSNGYSDSLNEGLSNGMESSEKCTTVEGNSLASHIIDNRLNSNSVSSIDNSVGNIFDNADDINFNKISSNPFMPNEDATKVTGNPFLNQGETKQNPMMDFFT